MKIEEFKKYKKLAESKDLSVLESSPEAARIYEWMKETGRFEEDEHLDEGILSSIWNWLKRNFSFTARRIHSLASDYENELREELRAEWKKTKNSKDLAAKFRAGTYNRLSRDIEEKMNIIAEDDEVYKDLVRTLINEKDLKVKKEVLKELTGLMDPEDEGTKYLTQVQRDAERDYPAAEAEVEKQNKKLLNEKKPQIDEIIKFMKKKLADERTQFRILGLTSEASQTEFIKLMYIYVSALADKIKSVEFDAKTVFKNAKEYLEVVKELVKRLERDGVKTEEAVKTVTKALEKHLKDIKNVRPMNVIKPLVTKEVESPKKEEESSPAEDVTTSHTEDVISKEDVEDGIETAKEKTGKEKPTKKDVIDEIKEEVEKLFVKDNVEAYVMRINKKVDNFNSGDEAKRKELMKDYDYSLGPDSKLKKATESDVEKLLPAFIDIVGAIVPFYQRTEDGPNVAAKTAVQFMFEIYAMKKDPSFMLSSSEKNKIIATIKEKYPDDYR